MENEPTTPGRSSARRKKESSGRREPEQTPEDHGNQKYFFLAAGSLIFALVAFVSGVQMGKALSDGKVPGPAGKIIDRKGQPPPFRFLEKGKEAGSRPDAKAAAATEGERPKEKETSAKISNGVKDASLEKKTIQEEDLPAPSKAKYTLQIAAFNNPGEAQELVNQFKKKGYDAYQVTGSAAAKGTLHRVRVGYFPSLQEARQFALTFEKKENIKPIITGIQNH